MNFHFYITNSLFHPIQFVKFYSAILNLLLLYIHDKKIPSDVFYPGLIDGDISRLNLSDPFI